MLSAEPIEKRANYDGPRLISYFVIRTLYFIHRTQHFLPSPYSDEEEDYETNSIITDAGHFIGLGFMGGRGQPTHRPCPAKLAG